MYKPIDCVTQQADPSRIKPVPEPASALCRYNDTIAFWRWLVILGAIVAARVI